MTSRPLRIGVLGGVPAALGGGGLEVQRDRTIAALRRLGHSVVRLESAERGETVDLLHAFGSEPGTWHSLQNWRLARCPLVVTSVIVVSPGRVERVMRFALRAPRALNTAEHMRREVLQGAAAVVAGNPYESELLTKLFGCDADRIWLIGNGYEPVGREAPVSPATTGAHPQGPFVLMVGAISARKRQAEILRMLDPTTRVVIVGPFQGTEAERRTWETAVARSHVTWVGELEPPEVREFQRAADVLIHFSAAEVESLAVIETLAEGTPVVLSDIPSHRALAARHSGWVRIVTAPAEIPEAVRDLTSARPEQAARVPSWDDVALSLDSVYRSVLAP